MSEAKTLDKEHLLFSPERKLGKKEKIMEAAACHFLSRGFAGTSMDEVSRAADVSKATVYAHFDSKESLFAAIVQCKALDRLAEEKSHEEEWQDLEAGLTGFARRFLGLILSPEVVAVFRLVVGESARFPELGKAFFESGPTVTCKHLADHLAREAGKGRLRLPDAYLAAQNFLYLLRSGLHFRMVLGIEPPGIEGHEAEVEALIREAVRVFLAAYGNKG